MLQLNFKYLAVLPSNVTHLGVQGHAETVCSACSYSAVVQPFMVKTDGE